MNVVKEIQRLNAVESRSNVQSHSGSWHNDYRDSAYIFVGGLDYDLSEGDIICIFSQYGEIMDVNLVRDPDTGKSKGFAFLMYQDQRSTVLAVDNLNGIKVAGRTLRVDHVKDYRPPKDVMERIRTDEQYQGPTFNAAPPLLSGSESEDTDVENERLLTEYGIDPEDPMADHFLKKIRKKLAKAAKLASSDNVEEKSTKRKRKRKSKKEHPKEIKKDRVDKKEHHGNYQSVTHPDVVTSRKVGSSASDPRDGTSFRTVDNSQRSLAPVRSRSPHPRRRSRSRSLTKSRDTAAWRDRFSTYRPSRHTRSPERSRRRY
ncbi:RNA-binding protein Cwf29 [Dispira parvispora]|uniref:RNA-binding protein Cwf29 n=1 Tax=Dispira parvispora TaxID=1520584 RepID=A0A9W8AQH4_9FUNG|nr:RNA-binding protein Cwf29 [Dispira parvispora]